MVTVYLAPRSRMHKLIKEVVTGRLRQYVRVQQVAWSDRPSSADIVVSAAALNAATERFASRLGTSQVAVLPEAYEWLQDKIRLAAEAAEDMTIVDAAFNTVDPLLAVSK